MSQSRRDFLKKIGLGGGALGAGMVLGWKPNGQVAAQDHQMQAPRQDMPAWQEMDMHHAEGMEKFMDYVGKDPLFWDRRLEPKMDGDVKVFELTCQEIMWTTEEGNERPAMAYNGIVPGPEIRVTEGDRVRVVTTNEMSQSTAVHYHGLIVPNEVDGVPFITQEPIRPGETVSHEFTVVNSGTHMYHSHYNSAEQVTMGLLGAFIVEPKDKSNEPIVDAEYSMILNDSALGFTINGRSFPYTQPIIAKLGERIRVRYYNEGLMIHPMHLHGLPQKVIAKDGFDLPAPYWCDTLLVSPGERYDVVVECNHAGVWAYHCHVLSHAEGRHGMFGMVTVLIVQE